MEESNASDHAALGRADAFIFLETQVEIGIKGAEAPFSSALTLVTAEVCAP